MADIICGERASGVHDVPVLLEQRRHRLGDCRAKCLRSRDRRGRRRWNPRRTALAKITALLEFMADELANDQAKVRFMAQFDAMYARDWPAERLLTLEAQINPGGLR